MVTPIPISERLQCGNGHLTVDEKYVLKDTLGGQGRGRRACHQRAGLGLPRHLPCLGILIPWYFSATKTRESSSSKRNTRSESWKGFHFTDGKTEAREKSLVSGHRAQQWKCWPQTQVFQPLPRTLSAAPSALPAGPAFWPCSWTPPDSPASPGSQQRGDPGSHLPGPSCSSKEQREAGVWRGLSEPHLAVAHRLVQGRGSTVESSRARGTPSWALTPAQS